MAKHCTQHHQDWATTSHCDDWLKNVRCQVLWVMEGDADEVQDAEDESNEDSENLDDDKVDDVVAEMMMGARKLMTRKFDDVHFRPRR